ncbi:U3 snoRNP protein [Malassezia equina]|uniref:U3 snoRNP protein n=1 Tax=Malassezia equina TaxID=1381935 RepID=A0AAF0EES7_9BASI|nr:U3 snoRNP protein [Malassezia equina]
MERVQYSLERSLPQLKLLDEHAILSKEELRSVTNQRQNFEARLIRRQAEKADFVRYLDFESDLNSLIVLRARERSREAVERVRAGDEDARSRLLPRTFFAKQAASYSAQCVAIFERLVRKFRWDVDAWIRYLSWAKSRKMRVVAGRIYARALALHPSRPDLWLSAADYELNSHADTTAARALLQRGLRMNPLIDAQDEEARGLKRARTHSGARTAREPGALRWQLTEYEQGVLRLWVEYMRMELVFVERLRRRWRVLGLDSGDAPAPSSSGSLSEAQHAAQSVALDAPSEDEDDEVAFAEAAVDADVPADEDEALKEAPASSNVSSVRPTAGVAVPAGHQQIMSGSIPLVVLENSKRELPPSVQLYLYVALLELFSAFPFFDSTVIQRWGQVLSLRTSAGAHGSGDRLRSRLMQRVLDMVQTMQSEWDGAGALAAYVLSGVYPLYHALSSATPAFTDEHAPPASQAERELADNAYLHGASQLCATYSWVVDGLYAYAAVPASLRHDKTATGQYDPWHLCRPVLFLLQVLRRRLVIEEEEAPLEEAQALPALASHEATEGVAWQPTPYLTMLMQAGDLPSLVQAAVTQFRSADVADEAHNLAFYTVLQYLRTPSRSGIDEPNLLAYLERVSTRQEASLARQVPFVAVEALARSLGDHSLAWTDVEALVDAHNTDPRAWLLYERAARRETSPASPLTFSWSDKEANEASAAHKAWIQILERCTQAAHFHEDTTAPVWGLLSAWMHTPVAKPIDTSYVSRTMARRTLWLEYLAWVQDAAIAAPPAHAHAASEWAWALGKEAVQKTGAVLASSQLVSTARAHAQALHDDIVVRFLARSDSVPARKQRHGTEAGRDAALRFALSSSSASVACWLDLAHATAHADTESEATMAHAVRLYKRATDQAERERDLTLVTTAWLAYLSYLARTRRDMAAALRELPTATTRIRTLGGDEAVVAFEAAWRASSTSS